MKKKIDFRNINYSMPPCLGIKYAVLILLCEMDGDVHILFEVRSRRLNANAQPGDISLPGGMCECDDVVGEALRETEEEVGIQSEQIEILGQMNPMTTGYGRNVIPVVGYIDALDTDKLKLNLNEVEEVFFVPLSFFLTAKPERHIICYDVVFNDEFPFEKIENGRNYKWKQRREEILFYFYEEYNIWGLTAKIIEAFVNVLRANEVTK